MKEMNSNNFMKEKFVKRNSIQRHIDFTKEIYVQAFKQIKEYPANFFSVFYFDIILTGVFLIFYNIFNEISADFLSWNYYDFILFFVSISLITKATYWFRIRFLNLKLLSGDLNIWISKPLNPFIALSLRDKGSAIYTTFIFLPPLIILLYFGNYQNYFYSLSLLLFGLIYYVFFLAFLQSSAFFIKENKFIIKTADQLHYINEQFTPKVFQNSFLWFLYLLPTALIGYFFIEILKSNIDEFFTYIYCICLSFLLFVIGTYLLTVALWFKKV